jgi:hypothetical protein
VKQWVVRPVADKSRRGAYEKRVFVSRRSREKTWEVIRPMRASGPDLD